MVSNWCIVCRFI